MSRESEMRPYDDGVKRLQHRLAGTIALEYASFAVDGSRPDLAMVVYNPATTSDANKILRLMND